MSTLSDLQQKIYDAQRLWEEYENKKEAYLALKESELSVVTVEVCYFKIRMNLATIVAAALQDARLIYREFEVAMGELGVNEYEPIDPCLNE